MRLARRVAGLVAAAVLVNVASAVVPSPVAAAGDQLQTHVDTTYKLQPERGLVRVTMVITLTNRKASTSRSYRCTRHAFYPYYGWYEYTTTCTTRTDYYYKWSTFYLEGDAVNVKVTPGSGTARLQRMKASGSFRLWKIHYSNLYYGKSRKLTLTYDLEGGGPRSDAERRVGTGYARFCVAGGSGDTGRVRVVVPEGYLLSLDHPMRSSVRGANRTYDSGKLKKKPWTYGNCLAGSNPAGVTTTTTTLPDGHSLVVAAWQDDPAWADVANGAAADVAAMASVLGESALPPALTIRESPITSPRGTGDTMLASELNLDREQLASTVAARAWFPADRFPGGWIGDGYRQWALWASGAEVRCEEPPTRPGTGDALASWGRPAIWAGAEARDAWADKLETACWVLRQLDAAIGRERMLEVIDALRTGADPWEPGRQVDPTADLRSPDRWLDVVTELGLQPAGADPHLAANLMVRFGALDAAVAAEHEAARDAWHAHQSATGAVPGFITEAMRAEEVTAARTALEAATRALGLASSAAEVLPGVEANDGPVVAAIATAASQEDLETACALGERQVALAHEVEDALAYREAPRDALQELGLLGTAPVDPAAVVAAVAAVDDERVAVEVAAIRGPIDAARETGGTRAALIAAAAGVLVLLATAVLIARRHRRRHATAAALTPPEPGSAEPRDP